MTEVISIGVALAGLLFIWVVLFKREGVKKKHEAMGGLRALSSGLLAAMCWASFDAIDNVGTGLVVGALVGITAGTTAGMSGPVRMVLDSVYMALGLVGSAHSVMQFATPREGQQWSEVGQNLAVLALVLIFAGWGFFLAFLRGKIPVGAALALFGTLEICMYISSPLGTALLASVPSVLMSLTVAVLLGLSAVMWPESVIVSAGLMTGFCVLAAELLGVTANSATTPWVATSILFAFTVPFFMSRGAARVVLGK